MIVAVQDLKISFYKQILLPPHFWLMPSYFVCSGDETVSNFGFKRLVLLVYYAPVMRNTHLRLVWCKLQNPLWILGVKSRFGMNLNFEFQFESAHELLINLNLVFLKWMNLNLVFSKSMNLNLVFLKSMNLNLKIKKEMNGSNPAFYHTRWELHVVPFYCWILSRKAVNTNFYSLCLTRPGIRSCVYRFSSRCSALPLIGCVTLRYGMLSNFFFLRMTYAQWVINTFLSNHGWCGGKMIFKTKESFCYGRRHWTMLCLDLKFCITPKPKYLHFLWIFSS